MDVFTRNYRLVCLDTVYKEHFFAYFSVYRQLKSCVKVEGGLTYFFSVVLEVVKAVLVHPQYFLYLSMT